MTLPSATAGEVRRAVRAGRLAEDHGPAVVVSGAEDGDGDSLELGSEPCVVIAAGGRGAPAWADVHAAGEDLDAIAATIAATPLAATSFAALLRLTATVPAEVGLGAESAVYSTLQAGPEFARWRAGRRARRGGTGPSGDDEDPVLVERASDRLLVTLHRPARHNALSRAMRDALCEALAVAVADDTLGTVEVRGAGPSFCSGGDLDEFGTRPDPATAHVTRLTRSPARLFHRLAPRLEVHLHGAAMGAGIELPAFAGRVLAHPDTRIALPELALGLVPGAGGTVSLPRRIGRHRTAWLGLSGRVIDARTALAWGLCDAVTAGPGLAGDGAGTDLTA